MGSELETDRGKKIRTQPRKKGKGERQTRRMTSVDKNQEAK